MQIDETSRQDAHRPSPRLEVRLELDDVLRVRDVLLEQLVKQRADLELAPLELLECAVFALGENAEVDHAGQPDLLLVVVDAADGAA